MTDALTEGRDEQLEPLVELSRNAARLPTQSELAAGLTGVRVRLAAERARRRLMQRAAVVIALVAAPLVWLYGGSWFARDLPALTYDIEGGGVLDGGYLRESGHQGVSVRFSEGSRFVLTPGSRGRLRTVDQERARVAIEHGTARIKVTPATGRLWEVEAGPFLVTVKGTAFTLAWDPADEQFELRLDRGRVVVSGPVSGGELALRAGQRLQVDLPQARTLITEDREAAADALPVASEPVAAVSSEVSSASDVDDVSPASEALETSPTDAPFATEPAPAQPSARRASGAAKETPKAEERGWALDLAKGRWDAILADAEQRGIAATLSRASSEELFALASAARYRRRSGLAHDALQTLRRRFPQSPRALDAVFLLGRVEETRGNGLTKALARYEEYLALAPNGAYAAEALGRKMTVMNKTAGASTAKAVARDYLRRFPQGSHAGAARAILGER